MSGSFSSEVRGATEAHPCWLLHAVCEVERGTRCHWHTRWDQNPVTALLMRGSGVCHSFQIRGVEVR